jgi:general secretion pathway protein G
MIDCLNKRKKIKGFTLIELLVVLLILGLILIFAINEYLKAIETARIGKAKADMEELVKAIRLHNIKENNRFVVEVFSPNKLGSFVGNYLEKDAPLDPWGNYYRHAPNLGIVYSCGPNKKSEVDTLIAESDDIVVSYYPKELFITKAEYVDLNQNNQIDFNDYIELIFSRTAIAEDAIGLDFDTDNPVKALGTVSIKGDEKNPLKARITLIPPIVSHIVIGETTILPREFIESIYDYSPAHLRLKRFDALKVTKRKK